MWKQVSSWGNLELFSGDASAEKKEACFILFGRNGFGKSTIARAFRTITSAENWGLTTIALCDESENEI